MRFSALFTVLLVAAIAAQETDAFKMGDFLHKMKNRFHHLLHGNMTVTKIKSSMDGVAKKLTADYMKMVAEKKPVFKVRDPKALKEFMKHMMFLHSAEKLKMHTAIMHTMKKFAHFVNTANMKIDASKRPTLNLTEIVRVGTVFMEQKHKVHSSMFLKFFSRHGIILPPHKLSCVMHHVMISAIKGANVAEEMMKKLREVSEKPITKATESAMKAELAIMVKDLKAKAGNELHELMKKHKVVMTKEELLKQMSASMFHVFGKMKIDMKSVEDHFKQYANRAMDLFEKAFHNKLEYDDMHNMMEHIRGLVPKQMDKIFQELKNHFHKKGMRMSSVEIHGMITRIMRPPTDREFHEKEGKHRKFKLICMIGTSVIGIIVIALVAVAVLLFLKRRRINRSKESVQAPPLPTKKENPYTEFQNDTESVTA